MRVLKKFHLKVQGIEMLRMRDNATVKELNIPKDKLEVLQRIMASKIIMDDKIQDDKETVQRIFMLHMSDYSKPWSHISSRRCYPDGKILRILR